MTTTEERKRIRGILSRFQTFETFEIEGIVTSLDVGQVLDLLTDIESLELNLQRSLKLTEEIADMAICKVEGAASELRRLVGYPTGPYPDLERK